MHRFFITAILACLISYTSLAQSSRTPCIQHTITHQYQYEDGSKTMDWPYRSWLDCGEVSDPDSLLLKKMDVVKEYEQKLIPIKKLDLLICTNQEALNQLFLAIEVARIEQRANGRSFAFLVLPNFFHNLYHLEDRILMANHPEEQGVKVVFHIFDLKRISRISKVVKYKRFGLQESETGESFYDDEGKELFRCYLIGATDNLYRLLPSYLP